MPKSRLLTRGNAPGGPAPISRHYRIFKDLVALINELRERGVEFVSRRGVLGLAFVVLIYVISTVCSLIFILFSSISYSLISSHGFDFELVMYVLLCGLLGLLFLAIGRWGQKRLKRSHV
jgi:hypothetical protein